MKKFQKSIFLFHKDLRLHDNTGLNAALVQSEEVIPVFIVDPVQANPQKNPFFNENFFGFLQHSLHALDTELQEKNGKLLILEGETLEMLEKIFETFSPDAFFSNSDYTAFAKKRDEKIAKMCAKKGVISHFLADVCLQEPGKIVKKDGTPYTVFTPFFKMAKNFSVPLPQKMAEGKFLIHASTPLIKPQRNFPTRKDGLEALKNIPADYAQNRNFPWSNKNTSLSIFLRMGLLSVREAFWAFFQKHGEESQGIVELFWRDFFIHIGHFFPKIFEGKSFHAKYDFLTWENDEKKFEAWCEGKTGFPLVDAGMRELKATGFMHNRVRMVVASFLVKNLDIDWRWGEKFFAQHLLDYDVAVNNGNWQWSASTGCDSTPYFRVFSPTSQHERFDVESEYVKKWIPELQYFSTKEMVNVEKKPLLGYTPPMCDSKKTAEKSKEKFRR